MANKRRSARIQKTTQSRSPAPHGQAVPPSTADTSLPSVNEAERQDTPDVIIPKTLQAPTTPTPKKSMFSLNAITHRTPRNQTAIKPSEEEMHPQLHHQTTAKPLEEARWLGFLSKGPQTEPSRGAGRVGAMQSTPSKIPNAAKNFFSTPEFKFKFKEPSVELSPQAREIMEKTREEAARIRAQMVAADDEFTLAANGASAAARGLTGRKIAQPKGKAGRFSDVHMSEFKKMDSIANHASAFRADPNRLKPTEVKKSLKRSPSKAELDKEEPAPKMPCTPAKSRLPAHSASHARPRSTIRLVPQKTEEAPISTNKRVKRHSEEDTSTARPAVRPMDPPSTPKTSISRLPGSTSRLPSVCTPTKSSIARSQSVRTLKHTQSNIPSLTRTPSTRTLSSLVRNPSVRNISPSRAKASFKEGMRQISDSLKQKGGVRGILKSPQRHFSNDPLKIAAGTHVATPERPKPASNFDKALPAIPATEPVSRLKRVEFTVSTVNRSEQSILDEPTEHEKNAPATPEKTVDYPVLYPSLEVEMGSNTPSPSRRSTISDLPIPGSFTFRHDQQIAFGPATSGSKVRTSMAGEICQEAGKKRKLDVVEESAEGSDKENRAADSSTNDEGRSPKKARMSTAPNTPAAKSKSWAKTPRRTDPKRTNGMTPSRLNFLAMPKRRKA